MARTSRFSSAFCSLALDALIPSSRDAARWCPLVEEDDDLVIEWTLAVNVNMADSRRIEDYVNDKYDAKTTYGARVWAHRWDDARIRDNVNAARALMNNYPRRCS